jgi:hypothetical protein
MFEGFPLPFQLTSCVFKVPHGSQLKGIRLEIQAGCQKMGRGNGYHAAYVRTREELEVDFIAEAAGKPPELIQVCLDTSDPATWEREVRALAAAAAEIPDSSALLLTLDSTPPKPPLPAPLLWRPAAAWLLDAFED